MSILDLTMFIKTLICLAAATAVLGYPSRITGGTPAMEGEIPFQVSIQDKDGNHFCGGAIVGSQTVITAASCIADINIGQGRIIAGTIDKNVVGSEHKASDVFIHPNFTMEGAAGLPHNDIAVILVTPMFPADEVTGRAFMPVQGFTVADDTNCTTSGWGTTSFGGPSSDTLLKVNVPTLSDEECTEAYADLFVLEPEMLCAGLAEGGADACEGDVGGPLFENGVVYGIFSVGGRCGEAGRPGIYTEVSAFRDWVDSNAL